MSELEEIEKNYLRTINGQPTSPEFDTVEEKDIRWLVQRIKDLEVIGRAEEERG
jgi:hypothetical protein